MMGCDSITNVISLLRYGRHKDRKFPLNSMVQLYALIWLTVQLGIVICIGIIGLTYNLDISRSRVNTQVGETSSINLTSLSSDNYLFDLSALQQWGVRGLALSPAPFDTLDKEYASYGSYLSNGQGESHRFFVDYALRFECNNTVSDVKYLNGHTDPIYLIPEFLSRMLGGMLGWSSTPPNGTREWQVYQEYNQIGWSSAPTAIEVADYVSRWTIAGVAAMDANDGSIIASGLPRMIVDNGFQPIQAQILSVKWWEAGTILGATPFVHFGTLILVIFFANKVIIKDDNPIAVAKVYKTLLNKVGDQHGCMLTGDQLIDSLEADHQVFYVIYGVADSANGIKHGDVCEQVSDVQLGRVFPEGDYDGVGPIRRRPRRTIDAHEYF